MKRLALVVAMLVGPGCRCGPDPVTREAAPVQHNRPAPPAQADIQPVKLYLDDELVRTIEETAFVQRRELTDLLPRDAPPMNAWTGLRSSATGDRTQHLTRISERFKGHTARLFVDPQSGAGALGMFAAGDTPEAVPKVHLDGLYEIRVSTTAAVDMSAGKQLRLQVGDGAVAAIDPTQLDGLPGVPPADASGKRDNMRNGWRLRDVVAAVSPTPPSQRIRLVPVRGEAVEVPAAALTRDGELLWLKRTRAGHFRFKWFVGEEIKAQLRAVWLVQLDPPEGADVPPIPSN